MTGGILSDWDADAHAVVATVLDAARKRGEDLLTTLPAVLREPAAIARRLAIPSRASRDGGRLPRLAPAPAATRRSGHPCPARGARGGRSAA